MHLHAHKLRGAHEMCTRAEPCDWSAVAQGVTTVLGVSLQAGWDTTLVFIMDPVGPMVQCNIVKTQVLPLCAGSVGDTIYRDIVGQY